jgi:hypothetical protein
MSATNAGTSGRQKGTGLSRRSWPQRQKKRSVKALWLGLPNSSKTRNANARSDRQAVYLSKLRAWWRNPNHVRCEFPRCRRLAAHVHHVRGRLGKLLVDERYWKSLCWEHHVWVHDNPYAGRRMGLLAGEGDWGRP